MQMTFLCFKHAFSFYQQIFTFKNIFLAVWIPFRFLFMSFPNCSFLILFLNCICRKMFLKSANDSLVECEIVTSLFLNSQFLLDRLQCESIQGQGLCSEFPDSVWTEPSGASKAIWRWARNLELWVLVSAWHLISWEPSDFPFLTHKNQRIHNSHKTFWKEFKMHKIVQNVPQTLAVLVAAT